MSPDTEYGNLATRVLRFLEVNRTAKLSSLKQHLNTPSSDLLIAIGTLIPEGRISVSKEGLEKVISLFDKDAEREE